MPDINVLCKNFQKKRVVLGKQENIFEIILLYIEKIFSMFDKVIRYLFWKLKYIEK